MPWNSEKLSYFKAHELSWTVNELCNRILRMRNSCPPIYTPIYTCELFEKIIFLQSLAPKWNTSGKKHTHTQTDDKTTEIRDIKL